MYMCPSLGVSPTHTSHTYSLMAQVEDVDDILDAYDGQESKLCRALYARLEYDPTPPH